MLWGIDADAERLRSFHLVALHQAAMDNDKAAVADRVLNVGVFKRVEHASIAASPTAWTPTREPKWLATEQERCNSLPGSITIAPW